MHEVEALLREYDRARAYTDELWKDLGPDQGPGKVCWDRTYLANQRS